MRYNTIAKPYRLRSQLSYRPIFMNFLRVNRVAPA